MPIIFDNDVANLGSTPGIITDTLANKPASATYGTMFIAIDTGDIQTWNGTAWVTLGGGGGGVNPTSSIFPYNNGGTFADSILKQITIGGSNVITSSLNDLIYLDEALGGSIKLGYFNSGNQFYLYIDGDNLKCIKTYCYANEYGFFTDGAVTICGDYLNNTINSKIVYDPLNIVGGTRYVITNNSLTNGLYLNFTLNDYYLGYLDTSTNQDTFLKIEPEKIQAIFNNNTEGIELSFTSGTSKLGYLNTVSNTDTYLRIEPSLLKTYYGGVVDGLDFDYTTRQFKFGGSSSYTQIDDFNQIFTTVIGGNIWGYELNNSGGLFKFGDFIGVVNSTYLQIDDNGAIVTVFSNNELYLNDNGTGNMISATASGSSGDHLVININGTQYKIALLNP